MSRGQKEVRLIFGSVSVEVITVPGAATGAAQLEATISLSGKEKLILRGHQVEDFMECVQALWRLKRQERDP